MIQEQIQEQIERSNVVENKVGIDVKNIDFITSLLTTNLYSKPLASFLRETVANAVDSRKEAGTDTPVFILIDVLSREEANSYNNWRTTEKWRISIRDYGTGLSPERFDQIYRFIGSSTKRESNDYIGCFGIGRFASLSLADQATITNYYNGTKKSYLMYKNGSAINIDELNSVEGDFKNGIEVSVECGGEVAVLERALRELMFFDGIYIEVRSTYTNGNSLIDALNSKKVVDKGSYCLSSVGKAYGSLYVKMGSVVYPIDSKEFPMCPDGDYVTLQVPMGSIDITPNRENIQYTDRTKKVINEAIHQARKDLGLLIENSFNTVFSIKQLYEFAASTSLNIEVEGSTYSIELKDCDFSNTIKFGQETIPENYIKYIDKSGEVELDSSYFYKSINKNSNKAGWKLKFLYQGDWSLALKKDAQTKKGTLEYFIARSSGTTRIASSEQLETIKHIVESKLKPFDITNIDECFKFTLKHLDIKILSNADTPKEWLKVEKTISGDNDNIRVYSANGYTNSTYTSEVLSLKRRIENKEDKGGFFVYTTNTRDDDFLKTLSKLIVRSSYYSSNKCSGIKMVFTCKESLIPFLQQDKRCIELTDFITVRNKYWQKLTEAFLIGTAFYKHSHYNISYKYSKFYKDYRNYCELCCSEFKDIIDSYIENGWIRQDIVDSYKLTPKEVEMLEVKDRLEECRDQLIDYVMYKLYGSTYVEKKLDQRAEAGRKFAPDNNSSPIINPIINNILKIVRQ